LGDVGMFQAAILEQASLNLTKMLLNEGAKEPTIFLEMRDKKGLFND